MGKYTKVITGGLLLYGGVAGATFLYLRPKAPSNETPHPSCGCNTSTFDRLADNYDTLIGFDEALLGINLLRRWYISRNTKVHSSQQRLCCKKSVAPCSNGV